MQNGTGKYDIYAPLIVSLGYLWCPWSILHLQKTVCRLEFYQNDSPALVNRR